MHQTVRGGPLDGAAVDWIAPAVACRWHDQSLYLALYHLRPGGYYGFVRMLREEELAAVPQPPAR